MAVLQYLQALHILIIFLIIRIHTYSILSEFFFLPRYVSNELIYMKWEQYKYNYAYNIQDQIKMDVGHHSYGNWDVAISHWIIPLYRAPIIILILILIKDVNYTSSFFHRNAVHLRQTLTLNCIFHLLNYFITKKKSVPFWSLNSDLLTSESTSIWIIIVNFNKKRNEKKNEKKNEFNVRISGLLKWSISKVLLIKIKYALILFFFFFFVFILFFLKSIRHIKCTIQKKLSYKQVSK